MPATASLLLTGLRDGQFSAQVPLDWLQTSVGGESRGGADGGERRLTVRIRDYRLEFYAPRPSTAGDSNGHGSPSLSSTSPGGSGGGSSSSGSRGRTSPSLSPSSAAMTVPTAGRLVYCGAVSLPIYVDPSSLEFQVESLGTTSGTHVDRLIVEGQDEGMQHPPASGPRYSEWRRLGSQRSEQEETVERFGQ
jgi:hypothetical protein